MGSRKQGVVMVVVPSLRIGKAKCVEELWTFLMMEEREEQTSQRQERAGP
jgi:hypothetical protein